MLYPRTIRLNNKEKLVADNQMCGWREHLSQNHRTLFLNGFIGARCQTCGAGEFEGHGLLMSLDTISQEPIKIVITSPGGELDSTFLLYDTMKMIKSPVITIGRYCASGAALLLAAGSKRYLFPHAKVMLHLPAGQAGGDIHDWKIQGKQMDTYLNRMVDILHECGVKKNHEELLADIDRDYWMEPKEAIAYGLCDEIMTKEVWKSWNKEDIK